MPLFELYIPICITVQDQDMQMFALEKVAWSVQPARTIIFQQLCRVE